MYVFDGEDARLEGGRGSPIRRLWDTLFGVWVSSWGDFLKL